MLRYFNGWDFYDDWLEISFLFSILGTMLNAIFCEKQMINDAFFE
jgi:hypothetical protein